VGQSKNVPKSRFWRWLFRALLILAIPYVLFCAGCAVYQRRIIYFPPVFDRATADQLAVSENLQRWNNASGDTIGWKRASAVQPAGGRVLVVHGNAGAAVECGHYADVIQQVAPFDVFIEEYPGYADRPGAPSERSLEESADEAFQLLATNGPVYLVGESLGTGVACWLVGKHPDKTAGVVLLAPYNTLTDVAQEHMPLLPVHLLLVDRFRSEKYLRNYSGPMAVLVGGADQVVPERFGRRLYDGYAGPKRLWEFPEGDHGTVMEQPPEIWKQIFDFLQANPQPVTKH
jgi:pimeloyl-ACP methyl ester carboxylesterase